MWSVPHLHGLLLAQQGNLGEEAQQACDDSQICSYFLDLTNSEFWAQLLGVLVPDILRTVGIFFIAWVLVRIVRRAIRSIVTDMVEKPGPTSAPSNLCIIGRYVLTPDIFDQIDALHPGQGGEIQLTDAMRAQALEKPIRAIRYTGPRFDLGSKADWLRATVRLATERADLGPEFRAFLREVVQSW